MHTAPRYSGFDNQTLFWALMLSITLHIFAVIWIPSFKLDPIKVPKVISVELALHKTSRPLPVIAPEPEPVPAKPKVVPKLIPKPEPSPSTSLPEPMSSQPLPAVITAEPKAETPPTFVTPPPVPSKPNSVDLDAARNFYSNQIQSEMLEQQHYPRIARERRLQGEVILILHLDSNGKLLSSEVKTSSGHKVLDKQAVQMAQKAAPFPAPPDVLHADIYNITVPVPFTLKE